LKHAKKLEQKKKKEKGAAGGSEPSSQKGLQGIVASKRSMERRKDMIESKKDTRKMTAMQELKARREEKKVRGRVWLCIIR